MVKRAVVPADKQRVRVAAGVYLKRNGKYIATFRDPGRKQRWKEFHTKKAAELWRARALLDPSSVAAGKRSLAEVWNKLLEHHGPSLKRNTRIAWEQQWRAHIEPALGDWPISKITVMAVKDYLAELERKGIGAPTRHKCRSILHRIMQEAVENGELPSNPVSAPGTRVKLDQRKKARILTAAEVKRVIEAAQDVGSPSDSLAIEAMFSLGLRIGEMAGLQAGDVDSGRREITVRRTVTDAGGVLSVQESTKTNEYRVLPIPPELPLWPKLLAHMKSCGLIGQAPLFSTTRGEVIRPNNFRDRIWARAMKAAGIDDPPTPHSGRRTTASLLSESGVALATIQAIMGHSTLQQTGEYIDVPRREREAGLSKFANLYGDS